jgi:hypothetical protein
MKCACLKGCAGGSISSAARGARNSPTSLTLVAFPLAWAVIDALAATYSDLATQAPKFNARSWSKTVESCSRYVDETTNMISCRG